LTDKVNESLLMREDLDLITKYLDEINHNNLPINPRLIYYNFSKREQIKSLQDLD